MSDNPRILLIEDEKSLNDVIALNLELEGYDVDPVFDGQKAINAIGRQMYHLVVLDLMLPNVDGFSICKHIRNGNDHTQILMVSAKDSSTDKIEGLKLGADDYLAKPFDLEELILRVKSLLKRNRNLQQFDNKYEFGQNMVDFSSFKAVGTKGEIKLTKREVSLLELLISKEGGVVSRDEILQKVWGYGDATPNTRTIDNFILNFRKYFEKDPKNPKHFQSVWGVGYRFIK